MNEIRQQLDAYERWVAYLLVVTFLCLGFLSGWGRKEEMIPSGEGVYQGREVEDLKKTEKWSGKRVKKEKQKKRERLLVKKETV